MTEKLRLLGLFTPYQSEILRALYHLRTQMGANRYWRPRELGAFKGSHHSLTLTRLAERGLVEKTPLSSMDGRAHGYRISERGALEWEAFVEVANLPIESVMGTEFNRQCARRAALLAA